MDMYTTKGCINLTKSTTSEELKISFHIDLNCNSNDVIKIYHLEGILGADIFYMLNKLKNF